MASLYGADPARFGVLSPRLGCDLETTSSRLSHVFPVLVNVVGFYAIYTVSGDGMLQKTERRGDLRWLHSSVIATRRLMNA